MRFIDNSCEKISETQVDRLWRTGPCGTYAAMYEHIGKSSSKRASGFGWHWFSFYHLFNWKWYNPYAGPTYIVSTPTFFPFLQ